MSKFAEEALDQMLPAAGIRRPRARRINADDPLEVLAALGGVSVTNPYELRLAVEGADAS